MAVDERKGIAMSYHANQGHYSSVESVAEEGSGEFEDFFPESARGELVDEETPYFGRDVVWIGDEGKMVRADPQYLLHIFGNIFDADKLSAVVSGIRDSEDRVYFYAPYGTVSRIGTAEVAESQEYWEDEGLDRPYTTGDDELDRYLVDAHSVLGDYGEEGDEEWVENKSRIEEEIKDAVDSGDGDLGEWVVTVRDGNHRAFGALVAGEPYVYVRVSANQLQDLKHGEAEGTLSDEGAALLGMLT